MRRMHPGAATWLSRRCLKTLGRLRAWLLRRHAVLPNSLEHSFIGSLRRGFLSADTLIGMQGSQRPFALLA